MTLKAFKSKHHFCLSLSNFTRGVHIACKRNGRSIITVSLKIRVGIRHPRSTVIQRAVLLFCVISRQELFWCIHVSMEQKSHNIKKPNTYALAGYSSLQAVSVYIVISAWELTMNILNSLIWFAVDLMWQSKKPEWTALKSLCLFSCMLIKD